jgi:hypothetical protein
MPLHPARCLTFDHPLSTLIVKHRNSRALINAYVVPEEA